MQKLDQLGILDSTIIYVTSDMGNPALHSTRNVPTVLAGGANGKFKMGRRLKMAADCPPSDMWCDSKPTYTPTTNSKILVSIAQAFGQDVNSFGTQPNKSGRHRRAQRADGLSARSWRGRFGRSRTRSAARSPSGSRRGRVRSAPRPTLLPSVRAGRDITVASTIANAFAAGDRDFGETAAATSPISVSASVRQRRARRARSRHRPKTHEPFTRRDSVLGSRPILPWLGAGARVAKLRLLRTARAQVQIPTRTPRAAAPARAAARAPGRLRARLARASPKPPAQSASVDRRLRRAPCAR